MCFLIEFYKLFSLSGLLALSILQIISGQSRPQQLTLKYSCNVQYNPLDKVGDENYQPLRIKLIWETSAYPNPETESLFTELITESADWVSGFLRVIPVKTPLRLCWDNEKICQEYTRINSGKCAEKKLYPKAENCEIDGVELPAEHMDGYKLYDRSENYMGYNPEPGPGVNDTDLILYVSLQVLAYCRDYPSVVGFTKICKRDQFNRPIASYVNMCPKKFINTQSKDLLRTTIRHEFLHAAGFLGDSIGRFQTCEVSGSSYTCEDTNRDTNERWKNVLSGDGRIGVLSSRYVAAAAQRHFQCSDDNFGAYYRILNNPTPQVSEFPGDHWSLTFMVGSIMYPFIEQGEVYYMDPMTVGIFKDMGWYKLNDSYTNYDYLWGKNQGCNFGKESMCAAVNNGSVENDFFCSKLHKPHGCHYLRYYKGECTSDGPTSCSYYKAGRGSECFMEKDSSDSIEEFCPDCRCFTTNLHHASQELTFRGVCLERNCTNGNLYIKINDQWILCPYTEKIQVPGYEGYIDCPSSAYLCTEQDLTFTHKLLASQTSTTKSSTTSTTYKPTTENYHKTTVNYEPRSPISNVFFIISAMFLMIF